MDPPLESKRACFDRIVAWDNLWAASRMARRGRRSRPNVAAFELEREAELVRLREELSVGSYRPGRYRSFHIREPKRRLISAAPYRDRVVHHALVRVIAPLFERNFVADSFANQVGKGVHRAVDRYQYFARRNRWVIPFDIVKYFPSIDHQILKQQLRSRIRDSRVLWLCDTIIDGSNDQEGEAQYFPGDDLFAPSECRRGLPIGNLTSQFWANVYLHGLDNFIKRGLRFKGYVRYVDDFVLLSNDKARLWDARRGIVEFLEGLRIRFHERRAQPRPTDRPLRFLGYRCWPGHRLLLPESVRRFRRRACRFQRAYASGIVDGVGCESAWRRGMRTQRLRTAAACGIAFLDSCGFPDRGPVKCARVARGGSWNNNPANCRSARRNRSQPENRNDNIGCRLAVGSLELSWVRMGTPTGVASASRESEPVSGSLAPSSSKANAADPRSAHAAIAPGGDVSSSLPQQHEHHRREYDLADQRHRVDAGIPHRRGIAICEFRGGGESWRIGHARAQRARGVHPIASAYAASSSSKLRILMWKSRSAMV